MPDWEIQAVENSPSPPVPHTGCSPASATAQGGIAPGFGALAVTSPPSCCHWLDRFWQTTLVVFSWQPATLRAEGRCMHRSQHHWREGEELQLKSTSIDQLQSLSLSQYSKAGIREWFVALLAWAITKAHM